jgi:hypothetical protein
VLKESGCFVAATVGLDHMRELFDVARTNSPRASEVPAPRVESFSLESGSDQLREHFGSVRREVFENPLAVDRAEALLGYLLSTETGSVLSAAERDACLADYQAVIRSEGAFRITTATCLFIAKQPRKE